MENRALGKLCCLLLLLLLPRTEVLAQPVVLEPGDPLIKISVGANVGLEKGWDATISGSRSVGALTLQLNVARAKVHDVLPETAYLQIRQSTQPVQAGDVVVFAEAVLDVFVQRAERALGAGRLEEAERIAGQLLALSPGHSGGTGVRERVARFRLEREQRAELLARGESLLDQAERALRAEDLARAQAAVEEAEGLGQSGARVDALRLTIARHHVVRGNAAVERGEWAAADSEAQAAETLAGVELADRLPEAGELRQRIETGRTQEMERLAAEREETRKAERLAARIATYRVALATDRLAPTIDRIRQLKSEESEDSAVAELVEEATQASVDAAETARALGELAEALEIVRHGQTLSPSHRRLSSLQSTIEHEQREAEQAAHLARAEPPPVQEVPVVSARPVVEDEPLIDDGGGGKKWIWIAGGSAVVAGGVIYFMMQSDPASLEVTVDVP